MKKIIYLVFGALFTLMLSLNISIFQKGKSKLNFNLANAQCNYLGRGEDSSGEEGDVWDEAAERETIYYKDLNGNREYDDEDELIDIRQDCVAASSGQCIDVDYY